MEKEICRIILEDREFWSNCQLVVKISEPLVRIVCQTDGDEKLAVENLYEAMTRLSNRLLFMAIHWTD